LIIFCHFSATSQVIRISPEKPSFSEEVTLTFFADHGNKELLDYDEEIYVHTGLITTNSENMGSWKHVIADWGDNDKSPKLTRIDDNTYQLRFSISSLYGVPVTGGNVIALAFVFRNADGSLVGKDKGDKDIFYLFQQVEFDDSPKVFRQSICPEPAWAKHATIYEVNIRQYTKEGTFNAFSKHLPRLRELGVDILWFMPIQPIGNKKRKGTLGSYYSIKDYRDINPEFGTMEDFRNLVNKAHGMGFKIILDWVANHSAWDNAWMVLKPDWYTKDELGNMVSPYDWTDVADLNYDMHYLRKAMTEAMLFWVQELDIDGFRCDVAGLVPVDFWEDTSEKLNKLKEVWMLAEDGSQYWLLNKAFNANYGWH